MSLEPMSYVPSKYPIPIPLSGLAGNSGPLSRSPKTISIPGIQGSRDPPNVLLILMSSSRPDYCPGMGPNAFVFFYGGDFLDYWIEKFIYFILTGGRTRGRTHRRAHSLLVYLSYLDHDSQCPIANPRTQGPTNPLNQAMAQDAVPRTKRSAHDIVKFFGIKLIAFLITI